MLTGGVTNDFTKRLFAFAFRVSAFSSVCQPTPLFPCDRAATESGNVRHVGPPLILLRIPLLKLKQPGHKAHHVKPPTHHPA